MKSTGIPFWLLTATLLFGNFQTIAGSDSVRADSRSLRTRGAVEGLLRRNPPRLTFSPAKITQETFPSCQGEMKSAMQRLMRHPQSPSASPM